MRVLIVGMGGQLSLDLAEAFAGHDVVGLSEVELDIVDDVAVSHAFATVEPQLVVNAAAWTDVDACEDDPDRAHQVNALGPWWLARACRSQGAELIQVSTDYVFDGVAPLDRDGGARPYSEFDPVAPLNVYGRSKWAGEQLVRQILPEHVIVRTAWLNGARGNNFVRTMLRLAEERDRIEVVDDQIGSPTFTRDLATAIAELAASGLHGTFNRTNSGSCSWFEFARTTFELAGREVEVVPTSSDRFIRRAARPSWSVLDERHATAAGLSRLAPWQEGLESMLIELGVRAGQPSAAG